MQSIAFHSVVPQVFSHVGQLSSEIWQQDVTFEKGHLHLVLADSGKGKSTFCSYVLGYRRDYAGSILFDQQDIRSLKVADWVNVRQQHISYLFQELRLFPELTALENVLIKNKLTGFKSQQQIESWFERLGIADKLHANTAHLSFGQQQRVAMIRTLVQPSDFILVDEPISHLDDTNSHIMGEMMMEEARAQGAGVIVTSIGKHMDLDYEKTFRL